MSSNDLKIRDMGNDGPLGGASGRVRHRIVTIEDAKYNGDAS